ncbi:MAG: hypothetical protein WC655_07165, partial [Candidatus Hydrogenedentales bacterium]
FVATAKDAPEGDLQRWKQDLEASKSTLLAVLQTCSYGRKSNEAIAKAYSKEELEKLADSGEHLRVGMALYDVKRYDEGLEVFNAYEKVATNDVERGIALVWQGHLLDLLGKRQEAIAAYKKAAGLSVDQTIRHDQFGIGYNLREYPKERMETPFVRMENKDKD